MGFNDYSIIMDKYESRKRNTDARDERINKRFSQELDKLKDSDYTISSKVDIAITNISTEFLLAKNTVRNIINGNRNYTRPTDSENKKAS